MKCLSVLIVVFCLISPLSFATEDPLLKEFHSYGIMKCDKFIKTTSDLGDSFRYFFSKHVGGLDGASAEVSMVQIAGEKGNTTKIDYSYIETAKACFLHARRTVTTQGDCNDKVAAKRWQPLSEMNDVDYSAYKDESGMQMFVKDVEYGGVAMCLREISVRARGSQG